jgi:hypothetical protein
MIIQSGSWHVQLCTLFQERSVGFEGHVTLSCRLTLSLWGSSLATYGVKKRALTIVRLSLSVAERSFLGKVLSL